MNTISTRTVTLLLLEDGEAFLGYSFGASPLAVPAAASPSPAAASSSPAAASSSPAAASSSPAAASPPPAAALISTQALPGFGEVVINTAMTGYPEVLTDRSYSGQMLVMTSPHIGNYGIRHQWSEARANFAEDLGGDEDRGGAHGKQSDGTATAGTRVSSDAQINALIIRDLYSGSLPSESIPLSEYLAAAGVPGVCDVDTRALTLHIRDRGALFGGVVSAPEGFSRWDARGRSGRERLSADFPDEYRNMMAYIQRLKQHYRYDLVNTISIMATDEDASQEDTAQEDTAQEDTRVCAAATTGDAEGTSPDSRRVLLYDCGCKRSIVACLQREGCAVDVVSHRYRAQQILNRNPALVVLSNGPGDPAPLQNQVESIRALIGTVPILAICMGHQLLSRALGASTYKLPFGHHGVNHPVMCSTTDRLYVTSQNHEYAVDEKTLPASVAIWFRNTNDDTVEGILDPRRHIYSVQFHPEAAPGPHDTRWIFPYVLAQIAGRPQTHEATTTHSPPTRGV